MRLILPAFLLLSLASAPASALVRVAVYDLRGDNVDERTAAVVTDGILAELRKLDGIAVLGMNEVRAMLTHEANKQLVGCTDESCLAEISGALGVDNLVIGSLGRVGDSHVLNVKRVDVKGAAVVHASTRRVPVVDGQEFLALVGDVTGELFPDVPLRPGLIRGVNPELVHLLNPPPLPKAVFWGTTAVGLGLVALGAGLHVSAQNQIDESVRLAAAGTDSKVTRDMRDEAVARNATSTNVLIGAGVSMGLMAVEALFTDWYGYRDWKPGAPVPE